MVRYCLYKPLRIYPSYYPPHRDQWSSHILFVYREYPTRGFHPTDSYVAFPAALEIYRISSGRRRFDRFGILFPIAPIGNPPACIRTDLPNSPRVNRPILGGFRRGPPPAKLRPSKMGGDARWVKRPPRHALNVRFRFMGNLRGRHAIHSSYLFLVAEF